MQGLLDPAWHFWCRDLLDFKAISQTVNRRFISLLISGYGFRFEPRLHARTHTRTHAPNPLRVCRFFCSVGGDFCVAEQFRTTFKTMKGPE